MACTWKEEASSSYADGALDNRAAADFTRHLQECDVCRGRVAEARRVDALLRSSIVPVAPPPALLGKVAQAVTLERERRRPRLGWLLALRGRSLAPILASLALAVVLFVAAAGPSEVLAVVQRAFYWIPAIGISAVDEDYLVASRPVIVQDGKVTLTVVALVSDGEQTTVRYTLSGLPGEKGAWKQEGATASPPRQPVLRYGQGGEVPATNSWQSVGGSPEGNRATGGVTFGPLPPDLTSVDLVFPREYLAPKAAWPEGSSPDLVAQIPLARPAESGLTQAVPQNATAIANGVTLSVIASSVGNAGTTILVEGEAPQDTRVVGLVPNGGDPTEIVTLSDDRGRSYLYAPPQSMVGFGEGELHQTLNFEPIQAGASSLTLTVKSLPVLEPGRAELRLSLANRQPGETFALDRTIRLGEHDVRLRSASLDLDRDGNRWLHVDVDLGPDVNGRLLSTFSILSAEGPRNSEAMMGAREGAQMSRFGIALDPGQQEVVVVLTNPQITVEGPWQLTFPVGGQVDR